MSKRDLYLAAYDITSQRRLRRVQKSLKSLSLGGQKSIFECYLTKAERSALMKHIQSLVEPADDRFLLLRLDPRSRVRTLGCALPPSDPDWFYLD